MKFSIEKKNLELMKILQSDKAFNERAVNRIDIDWDVILIVERQRTGMMKREIKNVNLVSGEIEYGDIITASTIVEGKNNGQGKELC